MKTLACLNGFVKRYFLIHSHEKIYMHNLAIEDRNQRRNDGMKTIFCRGNKDEMISFMAST